ncbi:MAG: RHS repeat-associated core domain-containing protein [Arcicella sp.]|nr:RHS repeat-associated core domain-containing protein [Arcicella sp.]
MKKIATLAMILFTVTVISQTQTENYIKTTMFRDAYQPIVCSDFTQYLSPELLTTSYNYIFPPIGTISLNDNFLTASIGSLFLSNDVRLNITEIPLSSSNSTLPNVQLGQFLTLLTNTPTGYFGKIENNKFVLYSPFFFNSINTSINKSIPSGSAINLNPLSVTKVSETGGFCIAQISVVNGSVNLEMMGSWDAAVNFGIDDITINLNASIPDIELGFIKSLGMDTVYKAKIQNNQLVFYASQVIPSLPNSAFLNFSSNISTIGFANKSEKITYYDGLGRPKQKVASRQSPLGSNIITHIEYGAFGREEKEYLSYKSNLSDLDLEPNGKFNTLNFYSDTATPNNIGNPSFELTSNPFNQKGFENSPLNRVLEQGTPGYDWSISNPAKHTVKFDYQTNTINEVRRYKVVFPSTTTESHSIEVNGYYPPAVLNKKVTKDENWTTGDGLARTTQEFTDKEGKTVLKRTFTHGAVPGTSITHNTYYIYDMFGNLSYVIPPTASDAIDAVYNTTAVSQRNYPWTKMASVNEELASEYDKIFSEYKNEFIANADLMAKYGGQGGFSITVNSNNELALSINITTLEGMELRNGEIFSLKDMGDFKDAELGRIKGEDYEYIFTIKNNALVIVGSGGVKAIEVTFNGATKLVYNKNYPWSAVVDIDPKEAAVYNAEYEKMDNDAILTSQIENPYGASGGFNITVNENDEVSLDFNMLNAVPLSLKKGIVIPLNTERRIADIELGRISDSIYKYIISIKENSLFIEGDGSLMNVNLQKAPINGGGGVIVAIPQAVIEGLCYVYRYDSRNRLIEKRVPGKGWEYTIYDKLDRPVLTQDANLRLQNKWLFTKYDAYDRVLYTGTFAFTSSANNTDSNLRIEMQNTYNNYTFIQHEQKLNPGVTYISSGILLNYSCQTYPPLSASQFELYTINFYDDYSYTPWGSSYPTTMPGNIYTTPTTNTKSLKTGSMVRVLGTTNYKWVTNVMSYDGKGRLITSRSSNNEINTDDIVELKIDFTGKIIASTSSHTKGGAATLVTEDYYTFDHSDRLVKHTQKVGAHDEELIVYNKYDELGTLVEKKVGGLASNSLNGYANTAALQTINYNRNIRGWITGINDPINSNGNTNQLFSFKISYNTPQSAVAPLFNGNISETIWKTAQDYLQRSYGYEYDALNRIKNSYFSGNTGENYNEGNITYDKIGNIITMERRGLDQNGIINTIDQLSYSYFPRNNKLKRVGDTAGTAGFKDLGNGSTDDYAYDINGNMTSDLNKEITEIKYNHLNLPSKIVFNNADLSSPSPKVIQFYYDATGVKVQKKITTAAGTAITQYVGGKVYQNNALAFISNPEGYTSFDGTNFSYVYQYVDHLGNIRLSYTDADHNGSISAATEIIEENNYYPSGLIHKGYNPAYNALGNYLADKYRFQGQERQEDLGLNLDNFNWRNYDYTMGRFINIDPLADLQPDKTPYHFCSNNPVNRVDPTGMFDGDSTHTDMDGNVIAVYDDGDLGVYRHGYNVDGTTPTRYQIDKRHGKSTSAGGEKMGETAYWDEFIVPGTNNAEGTIHFGKDQWSDWKPLIDWGNNYANNQDLTLTRNDSKHNGKLDIKTNWTGWAEDGPMTGRLLNGKFATARSAGNYLAGMNGVTGTLQGQHISGTTYMKLAGAYQAGELNDANIIRILTYGASFGPAPYYGEEDYSGRRILEGINAGNVKLKR